jgi:AcrR family transcriptional regulator
MTTARPLRQDAVRNRERLVVAARAVFAQRGVKAPLEEIAREAGLAIGTLYNRFPDRSELVDAALTPIAERAVENAERAAAAEDPWLGFTMFIEDNCALFAAERGFADVYRVGMQDTPVVTAAMERLIVLGQSIVDRVRRTGMLRADARSSDVALLVWGVVNTMHATQDAAPDVWRRHLAIVLDGLRAEAAHPLSSLR